MFNSIQERNQVVRRHAETHHMTPEEADKHIPPVKDMNCPDCCRKHLAAAMSYAKEITNGHGKGGKPDHRPDLAGEIVNAEHHLQFISTEDSFVMRNFRHKLSDQSWIPENDDINFLRSLWLNSERLEAQKDKTGCKTCRKQVATRIKQGMGKNPTVDVVIPLWTENSGYNNLELRLALRSIEKYLSGYQDIIVVTDSPPSWLTNVKIIPHPDNSRKNINLFRKRIAAAEFSDADYNLYCCDDYIFHKPVLAMDIPALTCGRDMASYTGSQVWHQCLRATAKILKDHNKPSRHCESHSPSLVERKKFLELAKLFEKEREIEPGLVVCGLYHNYYESTMLPIDQFKATFEANAGGANAVAEKCAGSKFLSFNNSGFESGVRSYLESLFPTPSRFEVDK